MDVAPSLGLYFHHTSGIEGEFLLPEVMGSGAALFDYDNDGDLDVYLVNAASRATATAPARNQLFRQNDDGTFVDATAETGLGDDGYGMGTALGDIDNDGDLDVLVTNDGPNRLYRNNGDGTFRNVTSTAGIEGSRWSTSAAFCDIDTDGLLDLYIANYVTNEPPFACATGTGEPDYCGPNAYRGVADRLYRNTGGGTFVDISAPSGIAQMARNGLGVVCFDFNDDARDDFLVANDGERNQLWINQGDGRFVDRGVWFGIAANIAGETEASMGVALGDVDGDLRLDALLTHLDGETNTLYLANNMGLLMDATALSGVGFPSVAYGIRHRARRSRPGRRPRPGRRQRQGAARLRVVRQPERRVAGRDVRATLCGIELGHEQQRSGLVRQCLPDRPGVLCCQSGKPRPAGGRHRRRRRPRPPHHQRQRTRTPLP